MAVRQRAATAANEPLIRALYCTTQFPVPDVRLAVQPAEQADRTPLPIPEQPSVQLPPAHVAAQLPTLSHRISQPPPTHDKRQFEVPSQLNLQWPAGQS